MCLIVCAHQISPLAPVLRPPNHAGGTKLDAGCAPEDAHEQAMAAAAAARREHPGGRDQDEVESLNRELREAQVTQATGGG